MNKEETLLVVARNRWKCGLQTADWFDGYSAALRDLTEAGSITVNTSGSDSDILVFKDFKQIEPL